MRGTPIVNSILHFRDQVMMISGKTDGLAIVLPDQAFDRLLVEVRPYLLPETKTGTLDDPYIEVEGVRVWRAGPMRLLALPETQDA